MDRVDQRHGEGAFFEQPRGSETFSKARFGSSHPSVRLASITPEEEAPKFIGRELIESAYANHRPRE
jgi:hypothetical protein